MTLSIIGHLLLLSFLVKADTTTIQNEKLITAQQLEESKKELNFLDKKAKVRFKRREPIEFESNKMDMTLIQYIIIACAVLFIILIVVNQSIKKEGKTNKNTGDDLDIDDISEVNLHQLLESALSEENYRLALRIKFLIILQTLEKKKFIRWNKYKTNRNYIKEIPDLHKESFKSIAYNFDQIWYGKTIPDSDQYQSLAFYYDKFNDEL